MSTTTTSSFQKLYPKAYYARLLEHEVRPDGRGLWALRACGTKSRVVSTCDGSALANVGRTAVMCGIRLEVGVPPSSLKPREGKVEVAIEGVAGKYDVGTEEAVRLGEALTRLCVEYVDLNELCILERRAVWVLKCFVLCLDDDGNVTDAAVLALDAALRDLKFPEIVLTVNDLVKIDSEKKRTKGLKLSCVPVPLTFGMFDDGAVVVADPSADEEPVLDGFFTILIDSASPAGDCVGFLKQSGPAISPVHLSAALKVCRARKIQRSVASEQ